MQPDSFCTSKEPDCIEQKRDQIKAPQQGLRGSQNVGSTEDFDSD
jgi:hypothetical protein